MKIVNFRVDDAEHAMMHALAESEGLNLTAYIRRHFAMRFQELGLAEDPLKALRPQHTQQEKPTVTRLPIPTNGNLWNEQILQRLVAGEKPAVVAESYGIDVQNIRDRAKRAQQAREAGITPESVEQYAQDAVSKSTAGESGAMPKDVWNDPERLGAINDAKFRALMDNGLA